MQQKLTIALSKGMLLKPTIKLFKEAGLPTKNLDEDTRTMVFDYEDQNIRYLMCRPTDVPIYVEQGAADLGIVGKDVIVEQGKDIYELADLGFGYCRFVVAVPEVLKDEKLENFNYKRVATKFPIVTEGFFRSKGLQIEIIKLHGNIELAPIMGLSDVIVDIVSTGRTLKENNLVELEQIMDSTTRLICNRVSYKTKHNKIRPLIRKFEIITKGGITT
ncbi:MAG TPA: ATP phosphoribosyltransferase [Syntrophomonadaceae bacterium]|nr:ATP phosphoribosyltransferase [Syntrophomonadaceae bacterium]